MKKTIIFFSAVCLGAFLARAWMGGATLPNPPRLPMIDAYSFAVQALGADTNKFYCVASKIDPSWDPVGAWVFTFDENAMSHKLVYVENVTIQDSPGYKTRPPTHVFNVDGTTTNSVPGK